MNTSNNERNVGGEQPIVQLMKVCNLEPKDIVSASTEQLTFKMVSRTCKGRMLTRNTQFKILNALNKASGKNYSLKDLFNH